MRVRATQIIPPRPHDIEVSEGVSVFVKKREIKILPLYRIRMVGYERDFDFLEKAHGSPNFLKTLNKELFYQKLNNG